MTPPLFLSSGRRVFRCSGATGSSFSRTQVPLGRHWAPIYATRIIARHFARHSRRFIARTIIGAANCSHDIVHRRDIDLRVQSRFKVPKCARCTFRKINNGETWRRTRHSRESAWSCRDTAPPCSDRPPPTSRGSRPAWRHHGENRECSEKRSVAAKCLVQSEDRSCASRHAFTSQAIE